MRGLLSHILLLALSFALSGQAADDPFRPDVVIRTGPIKGTPIDPVEARSIYILPEEEAAKYNPKPNEMVFANFNHDGQFWIAKMPVDRVNKVFYQAEKFGKLVVQVHHQIRFEMPEGAEVELFPQTADQIKPTNKIRDVVVSVEGFGPTGNRVSGPISGVERRYVLPYRVKSIDKAVHEAVVMDKGRPIFQYPITDDPAKAVELLQYSLRQSHDNWHMPETYHLLTQSCSTELCRTFDSVWAKTLVEKARTKLGGFGAIIPGWIRMALSIRGVVENGSPREKTANVEFQDLITGRLATLPTDSKLSRQGDESAKHENFKVPLSPYTGIPVANAVDAVPSDKVIIFYSSVGMGHQNAALAIKEKIETQAAKEGRKEEVVLKNIKDFTKRPLRSKLEDGVYWTLVKRAPSWFDKMFWKFQGQLNQKDLVVNAQDEYDPLEALKFIESEKASRVITTHYGSALVMGKLREEGFLPQIPVAWLHTDYFEGGFPRVANLQDRTFVGDEGLREIFVKAGVDPTKIFTTGLPVSKNLDLPIDREAFMKSQGLDPAVKTVVISGGGEGVGDFPAYVDSIAKAVGKDHVQIVVACSKNDKHFEALTKMLPKLPSNVKLIPLKGFRKDLMDFVKISDVYVTKSGGMSPTEAIYLNKPTVFTDVYGGHERENARRFEEEIGLGLVNRVPSEIGDQIKRLLTPSPKLAAMLETQKKFKANMILDPVVDFALHSEVTLPEKRIRAKDVEVAKSLAELSKASPAEAEIFLSALHEKQGKPSVQMRVGEIVYVFDPTQKPSRRVMKIPAQHYLYGTSPHNEREVAGVHFGVAHQQDVVSIRIRNLSPKQIAQLKSMASATGRSTAISHVVQALLADDVHLLDSDIERPESEKSSADTFAKIHEQMLVNPDVAMEGAVYVRTRAPDIEGVNWDEAVIQTESIQYPIPISKRLERSPSDKEVRLQVVGGIDLEKVEESKKIPEKFSKWESSLREKEARLEETMNYLQSHELTAVGLQKTFENLKKKVSAEDLQRIVNGHLDEITNVEHRALAKSYLEFQSKANEALKAYHAQTDDLLNEKLDYLAESAVAAIRKHHLEVATSLSADRAQQLSMLEKEINAQWMAYEKGKSEFGKAKDGPLRTTPYRALFGALIKYKNLLSAWRREAVPSKEGPQYLAKLTSILKSAGNAVRFAPEGYRLLTNILGSEGEIVPGEAPLVRSMNDLLKKMTELRGMHVEVNGLENIPVIKDNAKELNVFVPAHRSANADAFVMSHFIPDNSMIFAAVDQPLSDLPLPEGWRRKMGDMLEHKSGMIVVGRGSDKPLMEMERQIKAGVSNTIVIYPEGSVPSGVGDTRPLREKFAWGLIQGMKQQGYKINIIPVTYPKNDSFMSSSQNPNDGTSRYVSDIHKPLDSSQLALFLNSGDPLLVNRWIRSTWLENLPHNSARLAGHMRMDEIGSQVETFLTGSKSETRRPSTKKANFCTVFEKLSDALMRSAAP